MRQTCFLLIVAVLCFNCISCFHRHDHSAGNKKIIKELADSIKRNSNPSGSTDNYDMMLKSIDRSQLVYESKATHLFSDNMLKDTFILNLRGPNLFQSVAIFTIKSHDGREIFHEEFLSTDLIGDDDDSSSSHQKSLILEGAKTFFDSASFTQPALLFFKDDLNKEQTERVTMPENMDSAVYHELNANPFSVSFCFSYGYEGTYWIAYSHKSKKAEIFYSSD